MNGLSIRFLDAELKDLSTMRAFIKESALKLGGDAEPVSELLIAANEAITNIILHGYQSKPRLIEIFVELETNEIQLRLLDTAPAFDPTTVPQPDISLPLDQRPYGGMGVHLMRAFSDELEYRLSAGGMNELIITKRNAAA